MAGGKANIFYLPGNGTKNIAQGIGSELTSSYVTVEKDSIRKLLR